MIGAFDSAIIWRSDRSELCDASITIPSRFASATNARPLSLNPFHSGLSVALSARSLFLKCAGLIIVTPSRWNVRISVRSVSNG